MLTTEPNKVGDYTTTLHAWYVPHYYPQYSPKCNAITTRDAPDLARGRGPGHATRRGCHDPWPCSGERVCRPPAVR